MKYARQPDLYSCGPTAILNAMKWAGLDASTKVHLPYLQFGCRTIDMEDPTDLESHGTTNDDFDRVLRYVAKGSFRVRKISRISLSSMKRHLKNGGAIAFGYHWKETVQEGDHFCFFAGTKRGRFIVVNDHLALQENTISLRTDRTIGKWLKKGRDYPVAWFLTPEE